MAELAVNQKAIIAAAHTMREFLDGDLFTGDQIAAILRAAASQMNVLPGRPARRTSTEATRTAAATIAATLLQRPGPGPTTVYFLEVAADIDEWIRNGPEVTATE
jgi:hypothetical protein